MVTMHTSVYICTIIINAYIVMHVHEVCMCVRSVRRIPKVLNQILKSIDSFVAVAVPIDGYMYVKYRPTDSFHYINDSFFFTNYHTSSKNLA